MSLTEYMEKKPTIETERLRLRPLEKDDANDLREWTIDKSIYKYWGKGPGKADKDPSLLFEKVKKPSKSFHLGIALKDNNKVIGEIWIYLIENNRMAKVALRLSPKYYGKGYATEALYEMCAFCFTHTELRRLWSNVATENIASIRVMEKCGFTREGLIRQGKMVSTWCDYYLYGLLKEDFSL